MSAGNWGGGGAKYFFFGAESPTKPVDTTNAMNNASNLLRSRASELGLFLRLNGLFSREFSIRKTTR